MPSNVSNKKRWRPTSPSWRSVRAATIMLPPRQTPHSTISPGILVSDDVSHGLCQAVDPLWRCHRIGPHNLHKLAVFNGEILRDGIRETIIELGESILGSGRTSTDDLVAK